MISFENSQGRSTGVRVIERKSEMGPIGGREDLGIRFDSFAHIHLEAFHLLVWQPLMNESYANGNSHIRMAIYVLETSV